MQRTIIVSNRLPVKLVENEDGNIEYIPSEGGLATGLGSIYREGNNLWLGWPGLEVTEPERQKKIIRELSGLSLHPVFLSKEEISNYYEGFSNETLWPVFHYMTTYAVYQKEWWDCYVQVNQKFCDEVVKIASPGDIIWVHDYQLLLLPKMIRDKIPEITIGFFQHIPFPSFELFRLIPWRTEILEGMLGADLLGFHTFDDARHFVHTTRSLLPVNSSSNVITVDHRQVVVDTFPMGIDSKKFEESTKNPAVHAEIKSIKETLRGMKIVLSIDRLDYSKGILQRLQAFELLLQNYPEYHEKIVLYMIVVPSRDSVPQYKELREEIDKLVGNINARFRSVSWTPIVYFYRAFPFETISALYATADICLVTPMRDGMNLVCKEYVASRVNNDGVLILSEMAGASKELIDAIIVNPNNIEAIVEAIHTAMEMPRDEQRKRISYMRQIVHKFNISHWVKIFMDKLQEVKEMQANLLARGVGDSTRDYIRSLYINASKRIILLDYDGTLVGFQKDIEKAQPDEELYNILKDLSSNPENSVVIISGRNHGFLEKWFGNLPIHFIAEHGAWMKLHGKKWKRLPGLGAEWKKDFLPVLETFSDRTPGAFIEEKDYSLVWHYRKVEEGLGELRANELMNTLRYLAEDKGLQLLPGNKVIEIKNVEINKGKASLAMLVLNDYDFVMAIGDDHTDEDIFKALSEDAITIKVGSPVSAAKYFLGNYKDVRMFLHFLASLQHLEELKIKN
jgi:trehalose 6-phosphate synthase/phosphatase